MSLQLPVSKEGLNNLPIIRAEEQKLQVKEQPQWYGSFVKDNANLVRLPYVGEVPLREVSFRMVALHECGAHYNPTSNNYDIVEGGDIPCHLCIVVARYQEKYYLMSFSTYREWMNNITAHMWNLTIDSLKRVEGTKLDGYPYIFSACEVELSLKVANSGYKYTQLKRCTLLPESMEEAKAFLVWLQQPSTKELMATIIKVNTEAIKGE